jgi:hypothetical protein
MKSNNIKPHPCYQDIVARNTFTAGTCFGFVGGIDIVEGSILETLTVVILPSTWLSVNVWSLSTQNTATKSSCGDNGMIGLRELNLLDVGRYFM